MATLALATGTTPPPGTTALTDPQKAAARTSLGLGTAATAAAGDFATAAQGTAADSHAGRTDNPHGTTKAQVGLGNVDNLSAAQLAGTGNAVGDALAALASKTAITVLLDTSAQTLAIGTANSAKINAALLLTTTGYIRLVGRGIAATIGTHTINSNTALEVAGGLRLVNHTHLSGSNVPMFVNAQWQSAKVTATNGITDAALSPSLLGLRVATIDCGTNAHGLAVGQCALVKGDTSRRYLGVHRVVAVPDAFKLQVVVPGPAAGIGASSGTVTVQRADENITLTGDGEIDYNGQFNQADYGYNCMLGIFNKVRNLRVSNLTLLNSPKYAIYWGNLQHARFLNLTIYGPSAAIQGIGFGLDVEHQNVMGATNDDFLAYTSNNTGYTQFNVPTGDMDNGPLIGWTARDTYCPRPGTNVIAVYGAGTSEISGVLVDGIQCTGSPQQYCRFDAPATESSTFRDITIRNVRGQPAKGYAFRFGGEGTVCNVDSIVIQRFDFGSAAITVPTMFASKAVIGKFTLDGQAMRLNMSSSGGQVYVCQIDVNSTANDVTFTGIELNNVSGSAGSYMISHSGAAKLITVDQCRFYGTASANGGGTPTGSPVLKIINSYADTFRLAGIYWNGTLHVAGNTFGSIGGTACLIAYGSGIACMVRAYGNHWGSANNWLQIGASAGDTLQTQVWFAGNGSNGGIGTSIFFNETSGSRYLRQADAAQQMDATKWTGIDTGCVYYNNNAAYNSGTGAGIYAKGPTTVTRIAA